MFCIFFGQSQKTSLYEKFPQAKETADSSSLAAKFDFDIRIQS